MESVHNMPDSSRRFHAESALIRVVCNQTNDYLSFREKLSDSDEGVRVGRQFVDVAGDARWQREKG